MSVVEPPFLLHSQCQTVEKYQDIQTHLPRAKFDIVINRVGKYSVASAEVDGSDSDSDSDGNDSGGLSDSHIEAGLALVCERKQEPEFMSSNKTLPEVPLRKYLCKCYVISVPNYTFCRCPSSHGMFDFF